MILFVGAGPGDPDLITVKGRRALEEADLVVYAGSLVPEPVLGWCRPGCERLDSAPLHLEEIVGRMEAAWRAGRKVVRLHTGDPAIYGAIAEQMRLLREQSVPFSVVPGVSSFLAAAAAIPCELTLPGVSQTVILTRAPGRTPVPAGHSLAALASHRATMAVFLSAGSAGSVQAELLTHYAPDTPAAIVQRASWQEQIVVRCRLSELAQAVSAHGIDRTALLLVGEALSGEGEASRLYDAAFSHSARAAREVAP